jgi:hypothetical protein
MQEKIVELRKIKYEEHDKLEEIQALKEEKL